MKPCLPCRTSLPVVASLVAVLVAASPALARELRCVNQRPDFANQLEDACPRASSQELREATLTLDASGEILSVETIGRDLSVSAEWRARKLAVRRHYVWHEGERKEITKELFFLSNASTEWCGVFATTGLDGSRQFVARHNFPFLCRGRFWSTEFVLDCGK